MTARVQVLSLIYGAKRCFADGLRPQGFAMLEQADKLLPNIEDTLEYLDAYNRISQAYRLIYCPALAKESLGES